MPYPEPLNLTTLFLCHLQKVTEVRFIKKDVNCNPSSRCLHDFSKNIHICKHIHNNGNDLDQTGKTQIIVLYKLTYRILHWSWANTLIFFKHYNVLFSMLFHLTWRLSRALDLPFEKWRFTCVTMVTSTKVQQNVVLWAVLVLSGIKLILLLIDDTMLWLEFSVRIMLITNWCGCS